MAKTDELELDPNAKPSGGKGKLIIIIVLAVLLTAGGVIAALYFMGVLGGAKSEDASHDNVSDEKPLAVKPAFYFDLQPAFIVNFEDQTHAAYLQIEMQAMSHDQRVLAQLTKHMPVIRNNILLLLGTQKFEDMQTRKGKEALQVKVLEAIRSIIGEAMKQELEKEHEGKIKDQDVPNVDQIYFTSFIMQ